MIVTPNTLSITTWWYNEDVYAHVFGVTTVAKDIAEGKGGPTNLYRINN